jgi:hypothetical protein
VDGCCVLNGGREWPKRLDTSVETAGRSACATSARTLRLLTVSLLLLAATALAATRPHYGGTLRVEMHEVVEGADPPQSGKLADLTSGFTITQWESGRRVVYTADPSSAGGRPFLDSVEVQMGRPLRDQSIALGLGRADLVESDSNEGQRGGTIQRAWSSSPVRVLLLMFAPRVEDPRVREALALSVDRNSIHNVILQRRGEISGALLPQWISGDAFLFPAITDVAKARSLLGGVPPAARTLLLGVADPANRRIADRIALNARDAGLTVTTAPPGAPGDVKLVEIRIRSADPAAALAAEAAALGQSAPSRVESPEALYAAERVLLEGFRVIPLFHLPEVYGVNPRVKGAPGITPLGEWHFENLWIEGTRP